MADLTEWLSQDWQDAEDKRAYFLNRVPKYGNDNDDVDAMAVAGDGSLLRCSVEIPQLPGRRILAGYLLRRFPYHDGRFYRRDA